MLETCRTRILSNRNSGSCCDECSRSTGRGPTYPLFKHDNSIYNSISPSHEQTRPYFKSISNIPALKKQKQRGSIVIFLVILWVPIILLIVGTIHLKKNLLEQVNQQRELDSCLFKVLENKCDLLNKISRLNKRLKNLESLATAIRPTLLIPGIGAAAKQTITQLQNASKLLVHAQNLALAEDTKNITSTLRCQSTPLATLHLSGLPLTVGLIRKPSLMAPDFPGLLYWRLPIKEKISAVQATSSSSHHSSGYCEAEQTSPSPHDSPLGDRTYRPNLRIFNIAHALGRSWLSSLQSLPSYFSLFGQ